MGGPTSPIWEFFEKNLLDPSTVACKKCKVKVSRGNKYPKEAMSQSRPEIREFLEPQQLGMSKAGAAKLVNSV